MIKVTTILILTFWTVTFCLGQTASVKIVRQFYDNSYKKFDSIQFQFNDTKIFATDTTAKQIKLNKTFDNCIVIIGPDTLHFLTKFKSNNEYIIRPGCCCAAFTLEPKNNPRRGTVTFKNNLKRDLGLVIAEANIDTVKANKTQTTFSYESAMCLFKPCSIVLVETEYMNAKYDYANSNYKNFDSLRNEQQKFVLSIDHFHFLHGEKIEIVYQEKTKTVNVRFNGYLTDDEFKHWHN